jgi:hypothetical protein
MKPFLWMQNAVMLEQFDTTKPPVFAPFFHFGRCFPTVCFHEVLGIFDPWAVFNPSFGLCVSWFVTFPQPVRHSSASTHFGMVVKVLVAVAALFNGIATATYRARWLHHGILL